MTNMPDFDSMSPEELMKWMESLAKRQGAYEGFTTDADMEVAEIDPDTVVIDEPGYVPYGQENKPPEPPKPPARPAAAAPTPQPTPPLAPQPVAQTPPPVPAAPTPAASGTPDFDSMSPEEMMKWMESLAKRQGAYEGFTTDADMDVAEIDPDSVVIDEPGYVPYGQENKPQEPPRQPARPAAAAPAPQPAAPPPAPTPQPMAQTPPPASVVPAASAAPAAIDPENMSPEELMRWMESLAKRQGANEGFTTAGDMDVPEIDPSTVDESKLGPGYVPFDASGKGPKEPAKPAAPVRPAAQQPAPPPPPAPVPAAQDDPWIGLGETIVPAAAGTDDPMDWLVSLAGSDLGSLGSLDNLAGLTPAMPDLPTPQASGPDDPLAWLEQLAKEQGASTEELLTGGNVPSSAPTTAQGAVPADPGYTDYSLESMLSETPAPGGDPADWLDQLAMGGQAAPEPQEKAVSTEEVLGALTEGKDVDPNDMAAWMAKMLEQGAERSDLYTEEDSEFDPDAPAVRSELPSWLTEAVGAPPPLEDAPEPAASAFTDEIKPPDVPNIPDWLRDEEETPVNDQGLEDIFASVEPTQSAAPGSPFQTSELDPSDPWVEAFEAEYRARTGAAEPLPPVSAPVSAPIPTPSALPPAVIQPAASFVPSGESDLPQETELPAGELVGMPGWMSSLVPAAGVVPPAAVSVPAGVSSDMPDWLREAEESAAVSPMEDLPEWLRGVDVQVAPSEVPDWLRGTSQGDEEEVAMPEVPAAITPQPMPVVQAPPAQVQPVVPRPSAPVQPASAAPAVNVAAAIQSARGKYGAGDINGALLDYEAVVRANGQGQVITELRQILGSHKENPVVYRVLGDALMRDGKLQEALDTYRKALNLL